MEKMKIEIWSDIACPYCYIGKRKLEMALAKFPNKDNVELVWYSYELDPSLPKDSLAKSHYAYLAGQKGIKQAEAKEISDKIAAQAKEVGLKFNFEKLIVTNTSDALRLVKLAKRHNLATEMEEALFKAHFTDGENVSDKSVLIRLGSQVGLKEKQITNMLSGNLFVADIQKDIDYSENKLNMEYIPFYLFNNKHIVQGSISVDDYLEVLNKAYAEWEQDGVASEQEEAISGQACSIDGNCSI